jgi:hypothetical protein
MSAPCKRVSGFDRLHACKTYDGYGGQAIWQISHDGDLIGCVQRLDNRKGHTLYTCRPNIAGVPSQRCQNLQDGATMLATQYPHA